MHEREKRYRQSEHGKATRSAAQKRRRDARGGDRDWRLAKYGLSQAEYDRMAEEQLHMCHICLRKADTMQHKVLRVDHDHRTGKVRGLLCHHCNVALGHFSDSLPIMRAAIRYLQENGAPEDGWVE